jgi:hypothetical protein
MPRGLEMCARKSLTAMDRIDRMRSQAEFQISNLESQISHFKVQFPKLNIEN